MHESNMEFLVTHNSGSNHNYADMVNPAFQFGEFDLSSRDDNIGCYAVNHLTYRRKENDGLNHDRNNKNSDIHRRQTIRSPDYALRKDNLARKFENPSSLCQSSGPTSLRTSRGFISATNYLNNTRNCMSNHRRKTHKQRDCISFFDIETDRGSSYKYRPGEDVLGRITLIVRTTFDLDFVQLVTTGQAKVTRHVSSDGYSRTFRETYLHRIESCMGDEQVRVSPVLLPGQYTIPFCIKLPSDLPSSLHHKDRAHGFSFDVFNSLTARLCGRPGVDTPWHSSACHSQIRVLLEKQIPFNVERDFDINAIPDAISPIVHTQKVYLGRAHQTAATVTVSTDRAVFLAGDNIRIHIQVSSPASHGVKCIKCCLQEHVITSHKNEPMIFSFTKVTLKNPANKDGKLNKPNLTQNFVMMIPTQTDMISPYSLAASRLQVEYFLSVDLRFTPASGKLTFKIPVAIGPCAEPINAGKIPPRIVIPFFNRPIRFPFFSAQRLPASALSQPSSSSQTASVAVTTKYSNGSLFDSFLCCIPRPK